MRQKKPNQKKPIKPNRIKKAAALEYQPETAVAPVLKAKGTGTTAENIIQLAKEHEVPLHTDPALVDILAKIDLDQQIPPELYEVVAEILALVYQLEKRAEQHE